MVLHCRENDLVTGSNVAAPVGLRHKVDAFGGVTHEDDLAGITRVQEAADFLSPVFVQLGRALAQLVRAAMDIRIAELIKACQRVNHGLRLLSRVGVVQVHKRLAVRRLAQDREIFPHTPNIIARWASRLQRRYFRLK